MPITTIFTFHAIRSRNIIQKGSASTRISVRIVVALDVRTKGGEAMQLPERDLSQKYAIGVHWNTVVRRMVRKEMLLKSRRA
jgi:hypothetical protein